MWAVFKEQQEGSVARTVTSAGSDRVARGIQATAGLVGMYRLWLAP